MLAAKSTSLSLLDKLPLSPTPGSESTTTSSVSNLIGGKPDKCFPFLLPLKFSAKSKNISFSIFRIGSYVFKLDEYAPRVVPLNVSDFVWISNVIILLL